MFAAIVVTASSCATGYGSRYPERTIRPMAKGYQGGAIIEENRALWIQQGIPNLYNLDVAGYFVGEEYIVGHVHIYAHPVADDAMMLRLTVRINNESPCTLEANVGVKINEFSKSHLVWDLSPRLEPGLEAERELTVDLRRPNQRRIEVTLYGRVFGCAP